MYPVLESIQKYLWPRLCKLDQRTLYELHYQMITFGKVFCTKSKPNCNACPMRAECRHFASAFASARLALPCPEEKRMVPSDASNATHMPPPPPVIDTPMSLPPPENTFNNDARLTCQPIIEEPTTPEPEPAELTISDIEDQYYEDDDEIATINLDMNEFTINLQKMQDSMQIQGDMSKALVALNPQAASIPTPKLKNVSRLRTEHLVYSKESPMIQAPSSLQFGHQYVDPIVERLDAKHVIRYRLSRAATRYQDGKHYRDLSKLNRDPSRILYISGNCLESCLQPENYVPMKPWKSHQQGQELHSSSIPKP